MICLKTLQTPLRTNVAFAGELSSLTAGNPLGHRETKQVTGIESCQCRSPRAQRNHIACALMVWTSLKRHAQQVGQNIYRLKFGLLNNYMKQQLRAPSIRMELRA